MALFLLSMAEQISHPLFEIVKPQKDETSDTMSFVAGPILPDESRRTTMKKLLERFAKDATLANAKRILDYEFKHPMSMAMISREDREIYDQAKQFWDKTAATNPSLIRNCAY